MKELYPSDTWIFLKLDTILAFVTVHSAIEKDNKRQS